MWEQFKRFPSPAVSSTVYVSLRKSDGRVKLEFRLWTEQERHWFTFAAADSAPEAVPIAAKRAMVSVNFFYLPDMNDQNSFEGI